MESLPPDEQREARIAQLRSQIETGAYTVPVQSLARKLLERLTPRPTADQNPGTESQILPSPASGRGTGGEA